MPAITPIRPDAYCRVGSLAYSVELRQRKGQQCAPADRQPRRRSATMEPAMKEPLQQIGPDYYRFVQLLIAQAELEQLHQWRVDVERRSKMPLGMSRAPDRSRNLVAHLISSKRHPTSRRPPARDDLLERHTQGMITMNARRGLSGASRLRLR